MEAVEGVNGNGKVMMNGSLRPPETAAEGGRVGEEIPAIEDSPLELLGTDFLEAGEVEHTRPKLRFHRKNVLSLKLSRTTPLASLILTWFITGVLLLTMRRHYLSGERELNSPSAIADRIGICDTCFERLYLSRRVRAEEFESAGLGYVFQNRGVLKSGTSFGRQFDTDSAVKHLMAKLQMARNKLKVKKAACAALEAERKKRVFEALEMQKLEREGRALINRNISLGLIAIMSERLRLSIAEFRVKGSPVINTVTRGEVLLKGSNILPIMGKANRLHQDLYPLYMTDSFRTLHVQLAKDVKKLVDEASRSVMRKRVHLRSFKGIEKQIREMGTTQRQLNARLEFLCRQDFGSIARIETLKISENVSRLIDKWRILNMYHMARQHYHMLRTAGKIIGTLKTYGRQTFCRKGDMRALLFNVRGIVEHIDNWRREDSMAGAKAFDMASFVKLGVSKSLNDRQLSWENKRAAVVAKLHGVKEVRTLKESEEERAALLDIKQELKVVASSARESNVIEDNFQPQSPILFSSITESCDPVGRPDQLFVRDFRGVGSSGTESGINTSLAVVRLLGDGASAVVAEVQFLDEKLQQKYGNLAMKIFVGATEDKAKHISIVRRALHRRVETELHALNNIANVGETASQVTQRTGLVGAHYVGLLSAFNDTIMAGDSTFVFLRRVAFSPLLSIDLMNVFISPASAELSMRTRVYIAQAVLRSVAHMHIKSFCHNDLKAENTGITNSGEVVIFDCDSVAKAGQPRCVWTKTNLPPESVRTIVEEGLIKGDFRSDSWGLGIMLYVVLSGGSIPFYDSDASMLEKFIDPEQQLTAAEMRNVESPVFNLRRRGVPQPWVDIVALLLQRDFSIRPTPLQILEAYPEAAQGPIWLVNDADEAP